MHSFTNYSSILAYSDMSTHKKKREREKRVNKNSCSAASILNDEGKTHYTGKLSVDTGSVSWGNRPKLI